MDTRTRIDEKDRTPAKPSDSQEHALSPEENLEEGLTDSMDASDPPSATQPGDHGEPMPSSGFTEEDAKKAEQAKPGR
jgi:hypothetical protein